MHDEAPRLLLTRPHRNSARLLADLAGLPVADAIVSPLIDIDAVEGAVDVAGIAGLVVTSANAVPALKGLSTELPVFCVGDRTAAAVRACGFAAHSAQGDAAALIALVLRSARPGPLLHLHGAHTRGDIAERLTAAGVPCTGRIVYRQHARPLTPDAVAALGGPRPVLAPLYSPRSARLLTRAGPFGAPLDLVVISATVAAAARAMKPRSICIADRPDRDAMTDAIARTLRPLTGG